MASAMIVRPSLLVALALVGLALWPLDPGAAQTAPARTEEELRAGLAGAWSLTVPRSEAQAVIDRGIERCVSEMNYFLQSVARDQMHANTPVNERIDIGFPDGNILVVFDTRFSYTTRPGVPTDFDVEGTGNVSIRQYFRDGHLEQFFDAALGDRWNLYELSADGTTMTVSATQQGPMMPVPMHFSLRYRRR
jgi:hypothetical protein